MNPQTVVALIATLAQAAKALAPEFQKTLQILTSKDADEIRSALAELQAAGNALHGSVHTKLAAAAETT
jgi:hypothetical protein